MNKNIKHLKRAGSTVSGKMTAERDFVMRLEIENFAQIRHADMIMDGITVIAGENNTGKSTVGKILFSLFNATSDIENKIISQRTAEIRNACRQYLRNDVVHHYARSSVGYATVNVTATANTIARQIDVLLKSGDMETDKIQEEVHSVLNRLPVRGDLQAFWQEIEESITEKIMEIINLPEQLIMIELLSRYFGSMFCKQVNSLIAPELEAKLTLHIKGKKKCLSFSENLCTEYFTEIDIMNQAIYIDNPFIVDKLADYFDLGLSEAYLAELLTRGADHDPMDGIISSVLAKEKLSEVYAAVSSVIPGNIVEGQNDEYYLEQENYKRPVSVGSLSTGMKSFLILKMLIEKGQIKERDVLILDEPEIHLHTQWQVVYAELVVLLQKYFHLSIVVTTHSPYFMDAINVFSVKHGVDQGVRYYLSSVENGWAAMEDVTDHIDSIYKKMASPIQMLDSLRYELNHQ